MIGFGMRGTGKLITLVSFLLISTETWAAGDASDSSEKLKRLEKIVETLLDRDAEKDRLIEELRSEISNLKAGLRGRVADDLIPNRAEPRISARPLPRSAAESDGPGAASASNAQQAEPKPAPAIEGSPDLYAAEVGDSVVRLKGIDFATVFTAGGSSIDGTETFREVQAGVHDPGGNGFTMQTADLAFYGGVDPYFDAKLTLSGSIDPAGGQTLEFDEIFAQTKSVEGYRLKFGEFVTNFGLFNSLRSSEWIWADQPVVIGRLLSEDNMKSLGTELSWSSDGPSPLLVALSAQNATSQDMVSFLSERGLFSRRPVGGQRFVERDVDQFEELIYTGRLTKYFESGDRQLGLGLSAAYGPNATGPDESTYLIGGDITLDYGLGGGDRLLVAGELIYRHYDVPSGDALEDWGGYLQGLVVLDDSWGLGLRLEAATGSGESIGTYASRADDPFRADRLRISPLAVYYVAPQLRVRMQYNFDDSDHLNSEEHAFWASVVYSFGAGSTDRGPAY